MIVEGVVDSFDEQRGDGSVLSRDGRRYYFHCVNIADGSRTILVSTPVIAERSVGRLGRDEVSNVRASVAP